VSGIVGIYYSDGQVADPLMVGRMLDVLIHRGPDGAKVWCEGSVGLGHRMLHTTPESLHEVLPVSKRSADLAITADARIDNRQELMSRLECSHHPAEKVADSQLILAAYEKWGEDCAEKLIGDFAFAIWDGRQRQLFCARDPIGIKPFYYHHTTQRFVFASEIKALLCLAEIPRTLNEVKIADFLVPIFHDQVSTYYKEIVRLPPAHSMTVKCGKVRTWSYWRLDPTRELQLDSDGAYVEAFRELFTEAVRCRLRSAFPVGSTLSGGLDSSAIACTAERLLAAHRGRRLHTFSAIFPSVAADDPRIDERSFIEAVLAEGDFESHDVRADQCYPLADVTWHKDEAWPAPSLYMSRAIFRTAHEHGVRVLLSGFDGDVVVSYGYEYLQELARTGRWAHFAREAHALAERRPQMDASHYLRHYGVPYLTELACQQRWRSFALQVGEIAKYFALSRPHLFLHAGLKPVLLQPVRWAWRQIQKRTHSPSSVWGLNTAIHPVFARRMGLAQRIQAAEALELAGANPLRAQHMLALTDGRFEYVANVFDHTASTFALEQRYPFFDRRLMEFCLALPFDQKLRHGWSRAIFRRAMEQILPPTVQWRVSKGNLGVNVRRRLLEERHILEDVIVRDPGVIEPYIDVSALRAAYRRYLSQPTAASEEDLFTIFLSVNLALWLRHAERSRTTDGAMHRETVSF
jgi:asparagine synthase (glutamine-hydrolysing)